MEAAGNPGVSLKLNRMLCSYLAVPLIEAVMEVLGILNIQLYRIIEHFILHVGNEMDWSSW